MSATSFATEVEAPETERASPFEIEIDTIEPPEALDKPRGLGGQAPRRPSKRRSNRQGRKPKRARIARVRIRSSTA